MTKAEATKLVAMLVAIWPTPEMTAEGMQVWANMIKALDFEVAQEAVARLSATSKWRPAIAELFSTTLDIQHGPKRLGGEAWGDVEMAIRRVGRYGSPQFEDPGVAECVRLLGWLNLCNSTNDIADRARFIELYDGLQTRARQDMAAGRPLPAARGLAALPANQPEHTAVRGLMSGAAAQLAPPWEPRGKALPAKPVAPLWDPDEAQQRAEREQERQRGIARQLLGDEAGT